MTNCLPHLPGKIFALNREAQVMMFTKIDY